MPQRRHTVVALLATLPLLPSVAAPAGAESTRARELGIPFEGAPGPLNAITDVAGVEVGHVTLIEGDGPLEVGSGPVRTGVTAIHPRGKDSTDPVFAGWFTLNASGEMTGTTWLEERGLVDGPIAITNTHSVGVVRDAAVAWMVERGWPAAWHAPVVAETYDGALNDINGFHVTREHALEAMGRARGGPVIEGAVGGGTGMVCNGFKGGIGTASRLFEAQGRSFTVGVLVQCNYNWTGDGLRLGGRAVSEILPVGQHCFTDRSIERHAPWIPYCDERTSSDVREEPSRDGSIIIVVATDAPLLPHQLRRLAKRPSLGLGRLGAISGDGSGDIFIAFSTANPDRISENEKSDVTMYPNNALSAAFAATVQATEEAVVNAMVAADTVVGASGLRVRELPEDEVGRIFAGQQGDPGTEPRQPAAFRPITDDPDLPRALLLGDSISIGYTLPVRELLKGRANVHRAPANCGPTTRGLERIDEWLGEGPWDVIHFNWGLHDLKFLGPNGENLADPEAADSHQQVPIDRYEENLRALVVRLQTTGARLVWASTTPVPPGAAGRIEGDSARYNAAATRVMESLGVPTNDLFAFARPRLGEIQRPANVHFTPEGSQHLAQEVARAILAQIVGGSRGRE